MRQHFPLPLPLGSKHRLSYLFACASLVLFVSIATFSVALTSSSTVSATTTQVSEHDKIEFLLREIENSNAIFIRNDKHHKPKEARDHLKFKLSKATKMFWLFGPQKEITVQDFIQKIASESSSTNQAYLVQFPEQAPQRLADWLQMRLKAFEAQAPAQPPAKELSP